MEEDPPAAEIVAGDPGWRAVSGLGAGLGRRFSPLQPVWFMVLSCRGGSSSDHHVGQTEEGVELMSVLGQPARPHFPMPE